MKLLNGLELRVDEEVLTKAILDELDLTPEEAVSTLAEKLGVTLLSPTTARTGDQINTEHGTANAVVLSPEEINLLREANKLSQRIFG